MEKGQKEEEIEDNKKESSSSKTWMCIWWSLVMSISGGMLLGFWEYQYHSTYSQLWIVPFGLILLITPVFIWFAVLVSDICNSPNKVGFSVHHPEEQ